MFFEYAHVELSNSDKHFQTFYYLSLSFIVYYYMYLSSINYFYYVRIFQTSTANQKNYYNISLQRNNTKRLQL